MSDQEKWGWLAKLGVSQELIKHSVSQRIARGGEGPAPVPPQSPEQPTQYPTEPKVGMPSPMMGDDCVVVYGKVPGPAEHVLCSTHGHVVDTKWKTIIAKNLDEYHKLYPRPGGGYTAPQPPERPPQYSPEQPPQYPTEPKVGMPSPMMGDDCVVVYGKVPGPAEHVLCSTHGHVVDTKWKTIIAKNLDEYKRLYPRPYGGGGAPPHGGGGAPYGGGGGPPYGGGGGGGGAPPYGGGGGPPYGGGGAPPYGGGAPPSWGGEGPLYTGGGGSSQGGGERSPGQRIGHGVKEILHGAKEVREGAKEVAKEVVKGVADTIEDGIKRLKEDPSVLVNQLQGDDGKENG